MTYDDVISLGWEDRHTRTEEILQTFKIPADGYEHIMSVTLKPDEDGFHTVSILYVDESVTFNEWENGDPCFYGMLKSKEDLQTVMRFVGIIEY